MNVHFFTQRPTANWVFERFAKLGAGAAMGAVTGIMLRTLGAGWWEGGYGLWSIFTGIIVCGPRRRCITQIVLPLIAIGTMVKTTIKGVLSVSSASPEYLQWVGQIAGIGGYLPIAFIIHPVFFSAPSLPITHLGPAVAGAMAFVHAVGTFGQGTLETAFWGAALSINCVFGIYWARWLLSED